MNKHIFIYKSSYKMNKHIFKNTKKFRLNYIFWSVKSSTLKYMYSSLIFLKID